jgi:hypothetical protein
LCDLTPANVGPARDRTPDESDIQPGSRSIALEQLQSAATESACG